MGYFISRTDFVWFCQSLGFYGRSSGTIFSTCILLLWVIVVYGMSLEFIWLSRYLKIFVLIAYAGMQSYHGQGLLISLYLEISFVRFVSTFKFFFSSSYNESISSRRRLFELYGFTYLIITFLCLARFSLIVNQASFPCLCIFEWLTFFLYPWFCLQYIWFSKSREKKV